MFPLPDQVLLPHWPVMFWLVEARYTAMARALLDRDERSRWIVVPRLAKGWQRDYHGNPAFHEVAVVGAVRALAAVSPERYAMVIEGYARVRVVETDSELPYRLALIEDLPDMPDPAGEPDARVALQLAALGPRPQLCPETGIALLIEDEPDAQVLSWRLAASLIEDREEREAILLLPHARARLARVQELLLMQLAPDIGHDELPRA